MPTHSEGTVEGLDPRGHSILLTSLSLCFRKQKLDLHFLKNSAIHPEYLIQLFKLEFSQHLPKVATN